MFEVPKQPLDGRGIGKTNIKHCKPTRQLELDL